MAFECFGDVSAFGQFQPLSATGMENHEARQVVQTVVDPPQSLGIVVDSLSIQPAVSAANKIVSKRRILERHSRRFGFLTHLNRKRFDDELDGRRCKHIEQCSLCALDNILLLFRLSPRRVNKFDDFNSGEENEENWFSDVWIEFYQSQTV